MKQTLLILIIFIAAGSLAWAQKASGGSSGIFNFGGPGFDYGKKADSKEKSRWTLQEWLAQKQRNQLMDLWLGMYAPSPYEFYLSGTYQAYDKLESIDPNPSNTADTKSSYRSYAGSVGAYATVVGLVGELENNTEDGYNDSAGSFNLRVLGNSVQGTHLILNYGQRTRKQNSGSQLSQQFAGADLDLYMTKFFGLHGMYRQYMTTTDATLGDVKGNRTEGGAFIDFGALRIFGNWFSDQQNSTLNSSTTKTNRTGIQSGIKFFF